MSITVGDLKIGQYAKVLDSPQDMAVMAISHRSFTSVMGLDLALVVNISNGRGGFSPNTPCEPISKELAFELAVDWGQ